MVFLGGQGAQLDFLWQVQVSLVTGTSSAKIHPCCPPRQLDCWYFYAFFYSCYIFNWKASPRFPISCYSGCLMHPGHVPQLLLRAGCGSRWDAWGFALTLLCSSLLRCVKPQRRGGYMCRLQICTEGQLVLNCTRLKHFSVQTLALL